MTNPLLRELILEMVESSLEEQKLSPDHVIDHVDKVDYDDYSPGKKDTDHMKKNKPVSSYHHGNDYHSHLYHTKTHSIIHHNGDKDPSKHGMNDGYHKIKGHISAKDFGKAMGNLKPN